MNSQKIHIAIRFFLLLVIFAVSTGFTAIVSYCTMSGESECCCGTDQEKATPIRGQQQISDNEEPCLLKTVAGGLADIRATITGEYSDKEIFTSIELLTGDIGHITPPFQESHFISFGFDPSPPSGNDLYIQHHSYLI